ncbi:hypothetical protein GGF46_001265 [Coemansia sp. RSA 552]|nr:hypothetical protein GGF46_001265 [Coemansia sp. RSA 552]
MHEDNSKAPRETCASSPCSSPLTPGVDPMHADLVFTDYGKRSATLDGIGAWTSVQPMPSAQAAAAAAGDIQALDKKYGRMSLSQGRSPATPGTATTLTGSGHSGYGGVDMYGGSRIAGRAGDDASLAGDADGDMDYSEVDEAILRGRSTTLPNIFAVPNPLQRFSTVTSSDTAAPISPASSSTFGMLSRHGSVSVNNSNRTVSPLGLSLGAIPIHQTASLDNQLTSPLESGGHTAGRLDALLSAKTSSVLSGSVSSTSSLAGMGNGSVAGVRRLPEYSSDQPSSLALASYTMGPPNSGEGAAGMGAAHDPANASLQSTAAARATGMLGGGRGDVYAKAGRHGPFGQQLPTMREENLAGELVASPSPPNSLLLRNASFPSVAPGAGPGLFSLRQRGSPDHEVPRDTNSDTPTPGAGYAPLRIRSLKDVRRPSLDTRQEPLGDASQSAAAAFERAAELQQSLSFGPLPAMAGLHRRHSLASTNPHSAIPGSAGPFAPNPPGDHSMYPPRMLPPGQQPASMYPYGLPPCSLPRQNGTAVQPPPLPYHQYHHQHQYSGGAFPIPRSSLFGGHMGFPPMAAPPTHQQPPPPPPHMLPPGHIHQTPQPLQPSPAPPKLPPHSSSSPPRQHSRRSSHPGIARMGTPAVPATAGAAAASLAAGSHPAAQHALLPNPATTITPNMPFADMGKGIAYQSLPKGIRVFAIQFKGRRSDLYFAPGRGMELKVIPTLAPPAETSSAAQEPSAANYEPGAYVLVEADRGVDLGQIKEELSTPEAVRAFRNQLASPSADQDAPDADVPAKDIYVKRIFRIADRREVADLRSNKVLDEQNALGMCQAKVQQRKLSMCVVDAEFQFDRRKLTFYFTAERRVDFRELVRDLFKHFKTRIWMCQQQDKPQPPGAEYTV